MKLEEFKERLEDGCQKLNLPKPKTTRQGFSFIKVELKISPETSIEIYFNEETQSLITANRQLPTANLEAPHMVKFIKGKANRESALGGD